MKFLAKAHVQITGGKMEQLIEAPNEVKAVIIAKDWAFENDLVLDRVDPIKTYKLIPHEVIQVSSIPACNFCAMSGKVEPGPYDFKTKMGPWANGCEAHWLEHRAFESLGTGVGQLWITEDQVTS